MAIYQDNNGYISYEVYHTPNYGRKLVAQGQVPIHEMSTEQECADDVYKSLRTLYPSGSVYDLVIKSETKVYLDII